LLATFGRPTIADDDPGAGPVAAIATALRALADNVLFAPCDLPWLDAATVSTVLAAAGDDDGGPSVVVAETDRLQPLLSWWRSDTLAEVEALRRAGYTAVHEIVTRLGARRVTVPAAAMRNVNRSADLG
nr:NTP transferase domain-containing protein [Acidimicrobiia bacterium]